VPRTADRVAPYRELAEVYDLVHAHRPYLAEARRVRALVRRVARRECVTLLDVACGSGRHLEAFSRWFRVAGVDTSRTMLSLARRRLPRAELHVGRMQSFDLGRQFDVVTCLFSAIGYVRSRAELRRTVRNLARHTAAGGVVVVEPWITPQAFRLGRPHYLVAEGEDVVVLRMNSTERRRGRSIFQFHHLVGRGGRVEHRVETHDLGLFDRRTMSAAFRAAGLDVRYVPGGLSTGRGLYVGVRPDRVDRRGRPTVRPGRSRGSP
jgi:SAM-dependent methyltransferase